MKIVSLFESVLTKLAGIPGLQFLSGYVHEYRYRQTAVQQSMSKYQGYVASARGAAEDVRGAVATEEQATEDDNDDDIEEEDEDDFETYMQ
jgi:hypothetical protein